MTDLSVWLVENQDWVWLALGVLFLIGEILIPGAFMMWLGFAALATGLSVFMFDAMSFEVQGLIFAGLSVLAVYIGRKIMKRNPTPSENENLNTHAKRFVGKRYVLTSAIKNGQGRAKVGDSVWTVKGPDLPEDTLVEVVAVEGSVLVVEKSE